MANSSDLNVSRDLLGIAILDPIVYDKESLGRAWKYMGPKMRHLAVEVADDRGWQNNLPADYRNI
jgi:hypothetical protein